MSHILKFLFSTRLSGVLLLLFALAMATATFIENDYNTETAKALVYGAKWFEIVLLLLAVNFAGNIAKYNLFSREKAPIFLFHLAFIIIILGAGITKYRGYEALMTIKEQESSNRIVSMDSYLLVEATKGHVQKRFSPVPVLMTQLGFNTISEQYHYEKEAIQVSLQEYVPNAKYILKDEVGGQTYLHLVISQDNQRKDFYIAQGTQQDIYGTIITFDTPQPVTKAINIILVDGQWSVVFPQSTSYLVMATQEQGIYLKDSITPLRLRTLHTVNNTPIVFADIFEEQTLEILQQPKREETKNPESALVLKVSSGNEEKEVVVFGGRGYVNSAVTVPINGMQVAIRYGSKIMELPFALYLKEFTLERYGGSESPSAFYSDIEVRDKDTQFEYRIFMNNVLNYKGYRFFQSAYLPDESGTILTINHDYWGTLVTYIGYGLLGLGMVISLLWKTSFFRIVLKMNTK